MVPLRHGSTVRCCTQAVSFKPALESRHSAIYALDVGGQGVEAAADVIDPRTQRAATTSRQPPQPRRVSANPDPCRQCTTTPGMWSQIQSRPSQVCHSFPQQAHLRPGRSCAPEGPSPRMATPPARSAPPVLRAVEPQARGGRHRDAALAGRGGALRAIARVGRAASRQPPERRAGDGRTPAQRRDPVRQGGPTVADARARNHPRRRQRRVDRDQRTSSGPSPGDATPGLGPLPWPESATSS